MVFQLAGQPDRGSLKRRPFLVSCLVPLLLVLPLGGLLSGCGTLLFPERLGQASSNRIDPNILVLDGVGLIFFIIPGLVAFLVDFATETIYLPEGVERGEGPFFHDEAT